MTEKDIGSLVLDADGFVMGYVTSIEFPPNVGRGNGLVEIWELQYSCNDWYGFSGIQRIDDFCVQLKRYNGN